MSFPDLKDPKEILSWANKEFKDDLALSCSFSLEDVTILHLLKEITDKPRVFALDTGRLDKETYQCAEQVRLKYEVDIEWYFPNSKKVSELESKKGLFSFKDSIEARKECCGIRKVESIELALSGLKAWITGLRQEQSLTRAEMPKIENDKAHPGLVKINPLSDWSFEQVFNFVKENNIPYNSLYDQGYKSIGCAPCTRAIKEGEHERAGRWWWESPEHKECGIHLG